LWQHSRLGVLVLASLTPRVSLHHSCFAILIVASPGVIISVIPAGIFAVHVPAKLLQAFAWICRRHKRICSTPLSTGCLCPQTWFSTQKTCGAQNWCKHPRLCLYTASEFFPATFPESIFNLNST